MDPTVNMTSLGIHPTDGLQDANLRYQTELPVNDTGQENYYDHDAWFRYYLEKYLTISCYAIAMAIGTIGNVIVVYTIWRCRHLHTVMYTLLGSLCVADLIMLVLVLPWKLNVYFVHGHFPYGDFMCRAPVYLHLLSAVSSVFHLTAISLERCYAVKFPLKSRTVLTIGNAYKIVVFVWTTSILSSIPAIFSVGTKNFVDAIGPYVVCDRLWTDVPLQVYALYQFFLVLACPMILITGAYAFIMHTLCTRQVPSESTKSSAMAMSHSRKYQAGTTHNGHTKTGSVHVVNGTQKLNHKSAKSKEAEIRQMTIMLVVVIVVFAVCWGPTVTFAVLKRFDVIDTTLSYPLKLTDKIFNLMSFLNSAMNPLIYALVSASFRHSCRWALKVCFKSPSVRRRPSNMSRATTVSRFGMSQGGGSTVVDSVSGSSVCATERV